MGILLHVDPKQPPMFWDDYRKTMPGNHIAIDGFVYGAPKKDLKGPWANFNHHEEVDRTCTRSTCAQVLVAIRQGLPQSFKPNGPIPLIIDANDCDEDVDLTVYLLRHMAHAKSVINPALNRLVHMEDMYDATAGSYPYPPELPILGQLAWIFDPYRRFRTSGEIDKKVASSYEAVIDEVGHRIDDHLMGRGQSLDLDITYDRIGGGKGWVMIREIGAQAKMGMFADGHTAYLSVRQRPDGRYTYVAGKTDYDPMDLIRAFELLNIAEGCTTSDCWGGGNMVGGSPRVAGSKLSPEEVGRILDEARLS